MKYSESTLPKKKSLAPLTDLLEELGLPKTHEAKNEMQRASERHGTSAYSSTNCCLHLFVKTQAQAQAQTQAQTTRHKRQQTINQLEQVT